MYKIYADTTLIYDSTISDHKIGKGVITLEANKSGSFVFSLYPDHFFYDRFVKLRTVITVYKSGRIVFRGRILNDVTDYWNNKVITCEGELGFLQDSIIRPFSHTGTPEELFTEFITEHNSQVDDFKQFKIGEVTVIDDENPVVRSSTSYSDSLSVLNSALTGSVLGGYFYITHGEDGTDPIPTINYLADFSTVSAQTIEFGSNLKNYTQTVKAEDIATAIIPFGASIESGDQKLTIESVNDGVDFVYNSAGVDLYGWIFKTVVWDDVTIAIDLKKKAEEYLTSVVNQNITIELNAIDLHLLDRSIESFKVCDYVHVKSEPHNLDAVLLCNKQTIDLLKPENDTVVLGYQSTTFTRANNDTTSSLKTSVEKMQSTIKQTAKNITLEVNNGETSSVIKLMSDGTEISSHEISMHGLVTLSGLESGTTVIDGGWIKTGTINADRINLSGAISWANFTDDVANTIVGAQSAAGVAYDSVNQIANGMYSGGTFIDGTSIYSPTIHTNEFNIYPKDVTNNGKFNLWGYEGNHLFEFLQIEHGTSISPYVMFSSPAGADASWWFNRTFFSGTLDFRGTEIVQPYFLITDVTSSSISIKIYNLRDLDRIKIIIRPTNSSQTVEKTDIASDDTHTTHLTNITANTDVVIGVMVNGNCIGFQSVRTKAS